MLYMVTIWATCGIEHEGHKTTTATALLLWLCAGRWHCLPISLNPGENKKHLSVQFKGDETIRMQAWFLFRHPTPTMDDLITTMWEPVVQGGEESYLEITETLTQQKGSLADPDGALWNEIFLLCRGGKSPWRSPTVGEWYRKNKSSTIMTKTASLLETERT